MPNPHKPKLGQHFLTDERAAQSIVDALGPIADRTVVEIGPGRGVLTGLLAQRAQRLILVELDSSYAAHLRSQFHGRTAIEIIEADILEVDLPALLRPGETADIIGNLPYYITSDILLKLFGASRQGKLRRAVLMMQREVADRVAAAPGVRDYGLLSATAQLHATVASLFTLPPTAFSPPPDVFSTVLRLEFASRFDDLGVDPAPFGAFLRQSFAQKRKTLRNNLRAAGCPPSIIEQAWPPTIPAAARAESLSLEQMALLFHRLNHLKEG